MIWNIIWGWIRGLPIKFVWDWNYWIAHKNPDYKVEWQNLVIEVTSTAYKRVETNYEENRIRLFEKHNHNCITVRIIHCRKDYVNYLSENMFILLKKLINEWSSCRISHTNKGEVYCL